MFYTYILFSSSLNTYYIGFSSNPEKRLLEKHNKKKVRSTKRGIPYILMAKKRFRTRHEALKEELRLKKAKNRKYLEWLICGNW